MTRGLQKVDLTHVRRGSSELARDINRDIVFEVVRANQPVSRANIARLTGLQASTVSSIVDQLISERWVRESGISRSQTHGRPPTMVTLNDSLAALAVDIHPRRATLAVVDLNGRFLSQAQIAVTSSPRKTVANIVQTAMRMKKDLPRHVIEGIGIALPGRVDPKTGRLRFAPNLGWDNFDIKRAVEQGTGMIVEMDNEANACLLAEMWFGHMDGVRNAVLITISEGIGAAILSNGELIYGKNNMAGELGHVPLDVNGPECHCGGRGCWEMYASSNAALNFYREGKPKAPAGTIEELLHLVSQGDRSAIKAVTRQAEYVGKGLSLISRTLAPQVILIAGDIVAIWQHVAPAIAKSFMAKALPADLRPRVVPAHQANLRGAAILVLRRHVNPGDKTTP